MEGESDATLPFLHVLVGRKFIDHQHLLQIYIHRFIYKLEFFVAKSRKINLVSALLHRPLIICSPCTRPLIICPLIIG